MENISYEKFKKLLDSLSTFDETTLNALYEKYSKKVVNYYFDKMSGNLSEKEFINFANKYSCYFDSLTNAVQDDNVDTFYLGTIDYMFHALGTQEIPHMNQNEEAYYGKVLKEASENLHICNFDDNLFPSLRMDTIIKSVYYARDYESALSILKEIKSIPYKLGDESILKNEIKYIKKFLALEKKVSYEELKAIFVDLDLDNADVISNIDYELDLLKKYIIAKNNFFKRNVRLVISFAKTYHSPTLAFEDIIQDGNLGLIRAINKFDPDKGCKFSTYASYWIKQTILRSLAYNNDTIRKPYLVVNQKIAFNKFITAYTAEYNKYPSVEEIAEGLNVSITAAGNLLNDYGSCISLDCPVIAEEDDTSLGNLIPDENALVESDVMDKDLKEYLNRVFEENLTEKEADILCKRFGLNDGEKEMTLEDIGQEYGLTRERIRQIESKTLRKLRKKDNKIGLRNYLD